MGVSPVSQDPRTGKMPILPTGKMPVLQIEMRPVDLDPVLPREAIVKKQFLVPATVFVHEPRHLHVEAAVFSDFEDAPFAPPTDRVQSRCRFLNAEGGVRNR